MVRPSSKTPPFSSVGTILASIGTGFPRVSAESSGSNIERADEAVRSSSKRASGFRVFGSRDRDAQRPRCVQVWRAPSAVPLTGARAPGGEQSRHAHRMWRQANGRYSRLRRRGRGFPGGEAAVPHGLTHSTLHRSPTDTVAPNSVRSSRKRRGASSGARSGLRWPRPKPRRADIASRTRRSARARRRHRYRSGARDRAARSATI